MSRTGDFDTDVLCIFFSLTQDFLSKSKLLLPFGRSFQFFI